MKREVPIRPVADRAALEERPLSVARVPDAFGKRGGCWIRGYRDSELEKFIGAATRGGKVDGTRLQAVQLAAVMLASGDPDGPRLLGPEPEPTKEQVAKVGEFPPAGLARLVQLSDDLSGLTADLQLAIRDGATFLPDEPAYEAEEAGELELVDLAALSGRSLQTVYADVFGPLGGVWVREYEAAEQAAWELLGVRGRTPNLRRRRWAKLAAVLVCGPEPDSPRLIQTHTEPGTVTTVDMTWIGTHLRPGEQVQLERMADALSGWAPETEARLAEAEVPLIGSSSGSGASTD